MLELEIAGESRIHEHYDHADDILDHAKGLRFIWLELTQHCNLRCRHCYTTSSPARPHNDIDWLDLLAQARALGCEGVQFIGGEPLTHPRINDYITFAGENGFSNIEIFSNAALLGEGVCQLMAKFGVQLATSFYSADARKHDAITLTDGSFDQTVSGIKLALEHDIPIRVGLINLEDEKQASVRDDIERTMIYLEHLGVSRQRIGVDNVRPVGRGSKITPFVSQSETLCGGCWKGTLAVSFDGNCYPCIFSRHENVGNIRASTLSEIVKGATLTAFRIAYAEEARANTINADCTPECNPAGCSPVCAPADPSPCNPWGCGPLCTPGTPSCIPGNGCRPSDECPPHTCPPRTN
ncbi:radical SAM protein [Sphingomonas sp. QA11]|uniref:radical SAM/SPASM domain-containing protein n=1 Tax=Sphingomonas sp. QA11 TaxID=2950605 RepID=UPI0023496D93|nr:radical SAM protein [Sphingomonas sp. QA11]WCM27783.1 radical SAM protein [Sphingomonas sp. QA11]